MKKQKNMHRRLVSMFVGLCLLIASFQPIQVQAEENNVWGESFKVQLCDSGLYSIMGTTSCDIGQMINYYEANATYPSYYANSDAPTIYDFCKIYIEECETEGIRAEVAFCQAMKETGFLRYGGDVQISQYNFAGLGATGGVPGNSFSSVREGVRAQVQHLKAYASIEPLKNPCVDPRYDRVTPKGCAPYVEWLGRNENPYGKGWATSPGYGYSIRDDYIAKLMTYSSYTTWYNGVNYAAVYNPYYYKSNNADVAKIFGGSGEALIAHFVCNGMDEGRQASSTFNVQSYRNQYVDLRNVYGTDLKKYYLHYINYGKAEGRKGIGCTTLQGAVTKYNGIDYSAVYSYNDYLSLNADVRNAYNGDDIAALEHFVNYGMREGRQANSTFSVQSYRNQYSDLRAAYGNNLNLYYMHYINYGKKEGRKGTGCTTLQGATTVYNGVNYATVYDYNYYINTYADVKNAYGTDDKAVLAHFVNYGMSEGRRGNSEFDVNSYRKQYADLRAAYGTNLKSYYLHYVNYGKAEGRKGTGCTTLQGATTVYNGVNYAAVYDYNYYVNKYSDIKKSYGDNDVAVLAHFVNYGMNEGRQASSTFNVHTYRNNYGDLQNAYGTNLKSYYLHYINYGQKEGRNGI